MLLRKNYPAFEFHYKCSVCNEVVNHPLCPFCLTTEIKAWLTLYPDLRNVLLPRIHKYLRKMGSKVIDSTRCFKCKNKRAFICPYCFTEHVFRELKRVNVNKIILMEFLDFFNFDFKHTGYSKEAERLGVI